MTPESHPEQTTKSKSDQSAVASQGSRYDTSLRRVLRQGWVRLRGGEVTARKAGLSMGLGVWIGSIPLFGIHAPVCLTLCLALRLDAVVGLVGTQVSNPLFAPWLVWLELQVGSLVWTGHGLASPVGANLSDLWSRWPVFLAIGAPLVATILAGVIGMATAVATAAWRKKRHEGSSGDQRDGS